MPQLNDLSRTLVALEQDATLIAVIEMGQSSWLVAGVVTGIERQPLKKLAADPDGLLQLLHRWRNEAVQAGPRSTSSSQARFTCLHCAQSSGQSW
jgi:transposase